MIGLESEEVFFTKVVASDLGYQMDIKLSPKLLLQPEIWPKHCSLLRIRPNVILLESMLISTYKTSDLALGFFIKVVDLSFIFPGIFFYFLEIFITPDILKILKQCQTPSKQKNAIKSKLNPNLENMIKTTQLSI